MIIFLYFDHLVHIFIDAYILIRNDHRYVGRYIQRENFFSIFYYRFCAIIAKRIRDPFIIHSSCRFSTNKSLFKSTLDFYHFSLIL